MASLSADLGVSDQTIYNWRRQALNVDGGYHIAYVARSVCDQPFGYRRRELSAAAHGNHPTPRPANTSTSTTPTR